MTNSRRDVVIVGGGIVGPAVALDITKRFPRLGLMLLLEKEDGVVAIRKCSAIPACNKRQSAQVWIS